MIFRLLVLVLSVLLSVGPAHADEAVADRHYRLGVALARSGKLLEARSEFEQAYAARPHPRVLYTLAKIALDLGDERAAKAHLERYLETLTPDLPAEEVQAVRDALAALETSRSGSAPADATPPQPPSEAEEQTAAVSTFPSPSTASPSTASPSAINGAPSSTTAPSPKATVPTTRPKSTPDTVASTKRQTPGVNPEPSWLESPTAPGKLLFATGLGIAAGGGALLLWNDASYDDLRTQNEQLQDASPAVDGPGDLPSALEHAREVGKTQGQLNTVRVIDTVGLSLIGLGAACIGTGLWLWITAPASAPNLSLEINGVSMTW